MNESFIRQQNPYINQNMPPRGLNGPGAGNYSLSFISTMYIFLFYTFKI